MLIDDKLTSRKHFESMQKKVGGVRSSLYMLYPCSRLAVNHKLTIIEQIILPVITYPLIV